MSWRDNAGDGIKEVGRIKSITQSGEIVIGCVGKSSEGFHTYVSVTSEARQAATAWSEPYPDRQQAVESVKTQVHSYVQHQKGLTDGKAAYPNLIEGYDHSQPGFFKDPAVRVEYEAYQNSRPIEERSVWKGGPEPTTAEWVAGGHPDAAREPEITTAPSAEKSPERNKPKDMDLSEKDKAKVAALGARMKQNMQAMPDAGQTAPPPAQREGAERAQQKIAEMARSGKNAEEITKAASKDNFREG